jgi:hypothetical protein
MGFPTGQRHTAGCALQDQRFYRPATPVNAAFTLARRMATAVTQIDKTVTETTTAEGYC